MKRNRLLLIAGVFLAAVAAGLGLWFVVLKPVFFAPPAAKPTAPGAAQPEAPLTEARHAGLNLYLAGESGSQGGPARLELTLVKTEIRRDDGHDFTVAEGSVRVMLQRGVIMKVVNDLVPAGPYGRLTLHFAPTGTLVAADGRTQVVFLPRQAVEIDFHDEVAASRTLTALFRLGLDGGLGAQNGVATFTLPEKIEAETYVLGGIFRNSRGVGDVWDLPDATLAAAVRRDLNLDISPKAELTGTPSFFPAAAPPSATVPTE